MKFKPETPASMIKAMGSFLSTTSNQGHPWLRLNMKHKPNQLLVEKMGALHDIGSINFLNKKKKDSLFMKEKHKFYFVFYENWALLKFYFFNKLNCIKI